MKQSYQRALRDTLVYEGGWADHLQDPGGATMKGVTIAVFRAYKGRAVTKAELRAISMADVEAIYRKLYWDKISGDQLPAGVDYAVFDAAVNSGPHQATLWLQRALGGLKVDGNIGPATLAAAQDASNHDAIVASICAQRLRFCQALKTWKTFGKGWAARIRQVQRNAESLALGDVGTAAAYAKGGEQKARITDAKPAPSTAAADAVSSGGTVSVVLTQTTDALTPLAALSDKAATIVAILTAVGGLLVVGGLAYRAWAKSKAKERDEALGFAVEPANA